jgi:hypothetical protein
MHIYNLSEGLTTRELAISRQLFNQYKNEADKFIEDYGAEAENVARGRSIKLAKNMATKESKQRIKEMIKNVLSTKPQPVEEVIDSTEYLKNRKAVEDEKNPIDLVTMDVPLLIRMLEFAKEDAKTDMDLHAAVENMLEISNNERALNMSDYNSIVNLDSKTND